MLWWILLPAKITFGVLFTCIVLITLACRWLDTRPGQGFCWSVAVSIIAFIPTCHGIMSVVDARRFGIFHYESFADIRDERIERSVPYMATNITIEKTRMGNRARYTITRQDLFAYLDEQWSKYGERSKVSRSATEPVETPWEYIKVWFDGLDWEPLKHAKEFGSPMAPNGAGVTYYLDETTDTVYHHAGYW